MDLWFVFLIPDLFVIIFLSYRERCFQFTIRRWCRICIGVFPFGCNSDGFSCLWFDFVGLSLSRDHDHAYPFSKLRKDLRTRIWDPGVSNFNNGSGGLRQFIGHTYGSLVEFVVAMCILVLPCSETSILLCIDIGIFFHLMSLFYGFRVLLLTFITQNINLVYEDVMATLLSDQIVDTTRKFVLSYYHLLVVIPNKNSSSEASYFSMRWPLRSSNKEMFFIHTFPISGRSTREKEKVNLSVFTEKRNIYIIVHQWVGRYSRHGSESVQATYQSFCSIQVMRKAFRNFIYKMIACYKCMKRVLNIFFLLPVRLLLESMVTSTSSSKLGF